jgi:hypothetical protein
VLDFQGGVEGTTSKDIINMMMVTQYLGACSKVAKFNIVFFMCSRVHVICGVCPDMLKDVGQCPTNSTTFVPHSISGGNTGAQVRDGLMQAASAQ